MAPFNLMGLPYNVRREIYKCVVVEAEPIEVTTFKTRFESWPSTSARVSGPVRDRWNYQWYAIRKDILNGIPSVTNRFALAMANRHLAAEVLEIVYGCNRFLFDNISDMNTFLLEIGPMRQAIRKVRVQDPYGWNTGLPTNDYNRVLFSLWPATSLVHISFNFHCVGAVTSPGKNRIQIDTLFKHLMPFLRRWHEENDAHTGGSDVLGLVSFFGDRACLNCKTKSRVCEQHSHTLANEECGNFMRMVAWELGLGLPRSAGAP